ncbi:hypothetical protein MPSEU_000451000 [Mayamaea pseudoterrestris]|nr:hypothetical protein MPSEU_000451000 [Mayamaea pseudoterrestris]
MRMRVNYLLALLHVGTFGSSKAAKHIEPSTSNTLKDWLRARCGPSGHSIWSYKGALYDPLNGNKIANVQGLELVRCLAETDSSLASKERYRRRCGDLAAPMTVAASDSQIEYAGTMLSRKLFCYTRTDSDNKLLESIRLRPRSPLQVIPADQAATVYDVATTYIQRGMEWIAHTEWPDGRAVCTSTQIDASEDEEWRTNKRSARSIEFTSYARPQAKGRLRLPDLTAPITTSKDSSRSQSTISPKRSALVQFGTSKAENLGKFGARETYLYQLINDKACTVRYTRYGEAPIWYGPGRMCTLELTGKRVEDMSEIPSLVAKLASERVLGFLSVRNMPVAEDDSLAHRCVEWFRGKGQVPMQVLPHESERNNAPKWAVRLHDASSNVWNKLKSSTTWSR